MSTSRQHQGHFARKRFGQNFLVDLGIIDSIVSLIAPERGQRMVEIGPGLGALTEPLVERLATPEMPLHAVELDRDLIARLQDKFGERLALHAGDALAFDFSTLVTTREKPTLRIVGNLPYNISSPLLFHLMAFAPIVIDQHFMLQNEVVERMVAEPGTKAFGRLSVMLQYRYVIDKLLDVPPESFQPPPKVDSAIVRMIPLAQPIACDAARLEQVVAKAFSQRRKVIRNCVAGMFTENDLIDAGIDPQARPEAVPVDQFVRLANLH